MTLIIDLLPHLDAGDGTTWHGDQNERPLSELGLRQAQALTEALAAEPIDALYSSPALRCRQSLEPLAERFGLSISVLSQLGEFDAWRAPEGWGAGPGGGHVGGHATGTALAAIEQMRAEHREGRVVACSHGQTIPTLVSFFIAAHGLEGVPEVQHRGQWYRLRFETDSTAIELCEASPSFPR